MYDEHTKLGHIKLHSQNLGNIRLQLSHNLSHNKFKLSNLLQQEKIEQV